MKKWTLNSWKNYPVKHIPKYEDEKKINMVLKKLKKVRKRDFHSYLQVEIVL